MVRKGQAAMIARALTASDAAAATLAEMRRGASRIVGGVIGSRNWWGRPALLVRRDGRSAFGRWSYEVVEQRHAEKTPISSIGIVATFLSEIVSRIQNAYSATITILDRSEPRTFATDDYRDEMFRTVTALTETLQAPNDPGPHLRTSICSRCEWGDSCQRDAFRTQSLWLLSGTTVQTHEHLHRLGIRKLPDLVGHPKALHILGRTPGLRSHPEKTLAQATKYVTGKQQPSLIGPSLLPARQEAELFVDFEGEGLNNSVDGTVFGSIVRRDRRAPTPQVHIAASGSSQDRQRAWRSFVRDLSAAPPTAPIFHYGHYDRHLARGMFDAFGGDAKLLDRFVDVHRAAKKVVVIADRSQSAKSLARALGLKVRHPDMRGGDAPLLWRKWTSAKRKERALYERLVEYNEDDLLALLAITDWLRGS